MNPQTNNNPSGNLRSESPAWLATSAVLGLTLTAFFSFNAVRAACSSHWFLFIVLLLAALVGVAITAATADEAHRRRIQRLQKAERELRQLRRPKTSA